jgi:ADP-ribose pyrophosphatase YjhB (NUDIX family)
MAQKIQTEDVFDVFQPGLVRGAAHLPFEPRKAYFYVEHPVEGWRVYLRAACFIHEYEAPRADRFVVVKRTGGDPEKKTWEPPKGQMEGRDGLADKRKSIMQLLKDNVRREVAEEAKIEQLRGLTHTGLVLQAIEPDFLPNTYFQYHVFSAAVTAKQIKKAADLFSWFAARPAEFRRLRADQREKDAISWSDEGTKKMIGRWSPALVRLYLREMSSV